MQSNPPVSEKCVSNSGFCIGFCDDDDLYPRTTHRQSHTQITLYDISGCPVQRMGTKTPTMTANQVSNTTRPTNINTIETSANSMEYLYHIGDRDLSYR